MEIKVTPSMMAWCRRLKDPHMCRLLKWKKASIDAHTSGIVSCHNPTYIMVGKLEDAGLIEWIDNPYTGGAEVIARLTDKGLSFTK